MTGPGSTKLFRRFEPAGDLQMPTLLLWHAAGGDNSDLLLAMLANDAAAASKGFGLSRTIPRRVLKKSRRRPRTIP